MVSLILKQGLGLALIGCALGLAGAMLSTRFIASLLHGVAPIDPLTFVATGLLLFFIALVACCQRAAPQRLTQ